MAAAGVRSVIGRHIELGNRYDIDLVSDPGDLGANREHRRSSDPTNGAQMSGAPLATGLGQGRSRITAIVSRSCANVMDPTLPRTASIRLGEMARRC